MLFAFERWGVSGVVSDHSPIVTIQQAPRLLEGWGAFLKKLSTEVTGGNARLEAELTVRWSGL